MLIIIKHFLMQIFQNKNLFNNIVQIFNHQYGAITQIIPLTLIILNNNLNVQIFSALSFAIGSFLNLFVINMERRKDSVRRSVFVYKYHSILIFINNKCWTISSFSRILIFEDFSSNDTFTSILGD